MYWKPEVFSDLFQRRIFRQLPPKTECVSLLKDFFENFNCMFPLFHQPTFMHLVDRQYSRDPYEGSGWWASLNVALAIAHRLRVMSNLVPKEEDEKAWAARVEEGGRPPPAAMPLSEGVPAWLLPRVTEGQTSFFSQRIRVVGV